MNLLNILASVVTAMQTLIPLPREVQWGNDTFDFSIPYRIENSCPTLAQNIYLNDFTQMGEDGTSRMCIIRNETMPAESYRLHITRDTLLIVAHDKEGFIHAGQTLKQLAYNGELPGCDILDAPRFRWRGCMIDVSRHYFDLDCLKRQVDIMASLKLNRLHLHLTDAAGWRLQIDRYPLLTQVAAWRTRSDWTEWWTNKDRRFVDTRKETPADGTYGYFYTKDEMRELIAYANEHGITIIPETHVGFIMYSQQKCLRPIVDPQLRRVISLAVRADFIHEAKLNAVVEAVKGIIPGTMLENIVLKGNLKL